jgi:hypothetical protein
VFSYYRIYGGLGALAWVKLFARCNEDRESYVHLLHFRLVLWLDIRSDIEESQTNKKRRNLISGMDKVILSAILLIQFTTNGKF